MKILVTGVNGQLGHDVMLELASRGLEPVGTDITPAYAGLLSDSPVAALPYSQLDLTDEKAVDRLLDELRPDAIIHCAAWTNVDAAEDHENVPKVWAINAYATLHLALACKARAIRLMYISTDYVFSGEGVEPWQPDCTDFLPQNVYGASKLGGELAVSTLLEQYFIVRIAWVFGKNGGNFVKTMLRLAETHDTLRVVCDQIGTPTYTADLARLLADMIVTDRYGVYHATNEGGFISWYDFAREIFRIAGKDVTVLPVTTAEYGVSKAKRPFNSRLDKSKLAQAGFEPLPDWRDALRRYIEEVT